MDKCPNTCVNCDGSLRHGFKFVRQSQAPQNPIRYDVCQHENAMIMQDGTIVRLTDEVVIR
jgi:hypothetical protein